MKEILYPSPGLSFCVALFSSCVQATLAILLSLDSHLCLLNSGSFQAPSRLSLPVFCPGNSLKIVNCGNLRVYLIPFLYLRDQYPSLPQIQSFVLYTISLFLQVVSDGMAKLISFTPSWAEAEFLSSFKSHKYASEDVSYENSFQFRNFRLL